MSAVHILATGLDLIRKGTRAVEPVIEEIIQDAEDELQMMIYVFTPQASHILELLERAAERGIKTTLVINCLEHQHIGVKNRLRSLERKYSHYVRIINFCDINGRQLHAKVVVADRRKAVIGSANLSWGGMVTNYEIGAMVEGQSAWELAELIDSFVRNLPNL